jgi:sn-glycerol 3-phosphate transport system permease protein
MIPSELVPWLVAGLPALVGAVTLAIAARRRARGALLGVLIGGAFGAFGGLLFTLPLNFCMFEPERKPIEAQLGLVAVIVSALLFIWVGHFVLRLFSHGPTNWRDLVMGVQMPGMFRGVNPLTPWLLLAPSLVVLALFLYYPAIDNLRLSTLLATLGNNRTAFVCLDNFAKLFDARQGYGQTLSATFFIAFFTVVLSLAIGLFIAYMAYQPVRGANVYRTLLIWPYAVSPVVAGIIFNIIFNEASGIANHLIRLGGGTPVKWLQDASIAPWTIIIASVWKSLGFNILFYIAGLQNVPDDLQEAASIDGANGWQRFFMIVLPLLGPITFFLVVTNITYAFFDTYGTIDFLTRGGPAGATSTMIYRVVDNGLNQRNLGLAAAQSLVLFAIVIVITFIQFRTSGRRVTYGA